MIHVQVTRMAVRATSNSLSRTSSSRSRMNVSRRRWLGMLIVGLRRSELISRRLRDITQETEHEQRRRIAEMEKDVTSFDDIQSA